MIGFVRSLLIYYSMPLVVSDILSLKQMDSIEREYLREILNLPKDIKREVICNVAQTTRPVANTIKALSAKCKALVATQRTLEQSWGLPEILQQKAEQLSKLEKIYIPKALAETIWAVSRGSTTVHYRQQHYCAEHKVMVDRSHIRTCTLIK